MQEPTGKRLAKSGRIWAFLGVVFSTVSVATCLVSFPLIFQYLLALQAGVQQDVDFCRGRTRDLVKEILILQKRGGADPDQIAKAVHLLNGPYADTLMGAELDRHKRGATATRAKDAPPTDDRAPGTCCTCHRGAKGPQGPTGATGQDGSDGTDGEPGRNGPPAQINYSPNELLPKDCPCAALPGDQGDGGPKGQAGEAGKVGSNGDDGKPGEPGPAGSAGPAGVPGKGGPQGPVGPDGTVVPQRDLPAGPPGTPGIEGILGGPGTPGNAGQPGAAGSAGTPGEPGGPGKDGQAGLNGKPGPKGNDGAKGGCDHCAPARLAPGY